MNRQATSPKPRRLLALRAAIAIAVVLSMSSCAALQQLGVDLSQYRPRVHFDGLKMRGIDWTKVDLDFKFRIDNPNPLNVKMDAFTWALDLAGTRALDGQNNQGIQLKANDSSHFTLPVSLTFARIFQLAGALKGKDNVPFSLAGDFGFNTPVGMVRVPYQKQGQVPVLHKPKISLAGVRKGNVNLLGGSATVFVDLNVANDGGGSAMNFSGFDYALKIGGKSAVSGVVSNLANVGGGAVRKVSLPVNLNLAALGMTVVSALTNRGSLPVAIDAKMQVSTPFGAVPLKIADGRQLTVL